MRAPFEGKFSEKNCCTTRPSSDANDWMKSKDFYTKMMVTLLSQRTREEHISQDKRRSCSMIAAMCLEYLDLSNAMIRLFQAFRDGLIVHRDCTQ